MSRPSAPPVGAEGMAPSPAPSSPASSAPCSLVRVPFRGGFLLAAEGHHDQEGDRPVILRPFCDALGIDVESQRKKLKGKPWAVAVMITATGADGKRYQMAALPLRAIPLWLATINPSKVAPEARPMLESYQREAMDVLYRHFLAPAPINPPGPPPSEPGAIEAQLAALSERIAWLEAGQGGRKLPPHPATVVISEPLLRQAWAAIQRRGVWRITPGRLGSWVKPLRRTVDARAALDGLAARGLCKPAATTHGAAFVVVAAVEAAQLAAVEVCHAG